MTNDGGTIPEPEPLDLESRVGGVEHAVRRLDRDAAATRMMAALADRDVAETRGVLAGHTRVLNAVRETQLEQGAVLAEHSRTLLEHTRMLAEQAEVLAEHSARFDAVDARFDAVDARFDRLETEVRTIGGTLTELVSVVTRLADARS